MKEKIIRPNITMRFIQMDPDNELFVRVEANSAIIGYFTPIDDESKYILWSPKDIDMVKFQFRNRNTLCSVLSEIREYAKDYDNRYLVIANYEGYGDNLDAEILKEYGFNQQLIIKNDLYTLLEV